MRRWWWIFVEALLFAWATRPRMARFPRNLIPIPPRDWMKWRLDTAYGEHNTRPPLVHIFRDTCTFLLWRRQIRALRKVSQ